MTKSKSGSELLIDILEQYGVNYMFGNPGTTELPIIQSVGNSDNIEYIMTMHEDIAVSAATGYSLGVLNDQDNTNTPLSVVNLHSTPGLLHGSANIYNGRFDKAPVIVTTGSQNRKHEQKNPPLSGDKIEVIKSIVKWSGEVTDVKNMPNMVRMAAKKALTPPMAPVFLDITLNSQKNKTKSKPRKLGNISNINNVPKIGDELITDLTTSNDPVIFVGDDVARIEDDIMENILTFAHSIGARVYGEVLTTRNVYDYNDDLWIGSLTPKEDPSHIESDLEVHIGCSTNTSLLESNIQENNSKKVAISYDLPSLNRLNDFDHILYGDMNQTINKINTRIDEVGSDIDIKSRLKRAKKKRSERLDEFDDTNDNDNDNKVSQIRLSDKLTTVLSSGDVIFDEGVTTGFVLRNTIDRSDINMFGLKGGGLGQGTGASIGLSLSEQDVGEHNNIVVLLGDGTFNYYPQGLYSAAKYASNVTYIVSNNGGYKILRDNKMIEREDGSLNFNPVDICKISDGYGVKSYDYNNEKDLEEFLSDVINKNEVNLAHIRTN